VAQKYSIYAIFRMQDQISPGIGRLAANMKHFGKAAESAGRAMSMRVTAPIALAGGAILKTAVGFEAGMNKVQARTGETGEMLDKLRAQAEKLGAETVFSASDAAEGMAFLAMAGWDAQSILAGMPGLLDLAASSETELGRAADIASNIMGAFNIEAAEAGRVADVLAAATASANVDMEMMAESFKHAGPIARGFGMSLEQTAAAVGLLGNVGIQGTQAGTALKNMMLQMVNPATDASKMLETLGVKTLDAQNNVRPFAEILEEFGDAIKGLGAGHQLKAVEMLFGKIPMAGAMELINQAKSGRLQEYARQLQDVEGRARTMAEIMQQGAPGAVERFSSAMEGVFLKIANSGLLDWFTEFMQKATELMDWMSGISPAVLKFASVTAMLLAAIGPILLIVGAMSSGIGALIGMFGWVGVALKALTGIVVAAIPIIAGLFKALFVFVAANPIVLAIAAIGAAIAAAAYVIYDNWDNITSYFSEKWAAVRDGFKSGFIDGITALLTNFNPFSLIFDAWDGLIQYITGFDLGAYLSRQVSSMASALPKWLRDMVGIGGEGERTEPAPVSSSVRDTITAGSRAYGAHHRLDVNLNGVPRGTRISNEQKGSGLDYNVGVGYAWGP